MKKITQVTRLKRAQNSKYGNPRWRVYLADGTEYYTKPDASCAYGLTNSEFKGDVEVEIENGQITYVRPVGRDW